MYENAYKGRIEFVDRLKGFAILLVVFGHVAERYLEFDLYPEYSVFYSILYKVVYSFHMPLFMMISGYLFSYSYVSSDFFLSEKRAKAHWIDLALVYLAMSVIAYVFKLMFSKVVLVSIEPLSLALIAIKPIGYLWYLHTLLIVYAVTAYVVKKHINYRLWMAISIVLCLISTFVGGQFFFARTIGLVFRYELFFFVGYLLEKMPDCFLFRKKMVFTSFGVALMLLLFAINQSSRPDQIHFIQLILAYGLSVGIFFCFKQWELCEAALLKYLGMICFSIYLLHQYPLTVFRIILPQIDFFNGLTALLTNAIASIILVIIVDCLLKALGIHGLCFKPYSSLKSMHIMRHQNQ